MYSSLLSTFGIEGGYFADAGFNVALDHLQEPEVLDLVAVGQAKFGIVSGEQVILARARDRDVVYVFEWFQQYPVGLVYDSSRDLSELDSLRGLAIGIPGRFGASYSGLTTLLGSAGLSEADVDVREIGFNAPEVFCLGVIDAAIVYVNNEPLQIQNLASAGECGDLSEVDVITVASQVDLVSNGLIVSRAHLEAHPAEVARMVDGLTKALRAVIDNPAAAYLASLKHVDGLPADEALLRCPANGFRGAGGLSLDEAGSGRGRAGAAATGGGVGRTVRPVHLGAAQCFAAYHRIVGCRRSGLQRSGILASDARHALDDGLA